MTVQTFDYTSAVRRVTEREIAAARLAHDYDALVVHFGLSRDSETAAITDAARTVVIDGGTAIANNGGAAIAGTLTADMLAGGDPGDAAHRVYWQAARAARIGLVRAIDRAYPKPGASPEPGVIRISLSGEGGETITLRAGDAGYDAAMTLIKASGNTETD